MNRINYPTNIFFLSLFFFISGYYSQAQEVETYVKSDTAFIAFSGEIANNNIEMFLQVVNDSFIQGYYFYLKYRKRILLNGKKNLDSLKLNELDSENNVRAIFNLRIYKDSSIGKWIDLRNTKMFNISIFNKHVTGDINVENHFNNSLIIRDRQQNYVIPINKYLDKTYNYGYILLYAGIKENKFYSLLRFQSQALNNKDKNRYGWRAIEQYLLFAKFDLSGILETVQTVNYYSDLKSIQIGHDTHGEISDPLKDSLIIHSYHLKEGYKDILKVSKSNIEKGIKIKRESIAIPLLLYDTIQFKLDETYNLVFKFKLFSVYNNSSQHYKLYSISESNGKDVNKFTLFKKHFIDRDAEYEDNKLSWLDGDYFLTGDYNFDGYKDIYYYDAAGSGVHNYYIKVWVYNPRNKKYELDKFLSSIPIYLLDEKNKIIKTVAHGTALEWWEKDYQFIDSKLKLVHSKISDYDKKKRIQTIVTRDLINKKWVEEREIVNESVRSKSE